MRRASSAWPSTLLILCEPVWLRSSRFSSTPHAELAGQPLALGQRRRPARVVAQQRIELAAERGVAPRANGTRARGRRTRAPTSRERTVRRTDRSGPRAWARPSRSPRLHGGCAPEPHQRPAPWRSLGRPGALALLAHRDFTGAAPPNPISVRLPGGRSAAPERSLCSLTATSRGLRPEPHQRPAPWRSLGRPGSLAPLAHRSSSCQSKGRASSSP